MTESEWNECDDVGRMLCCVLEGFDPCIGVRKNNQVPIPKTTDRRARLFVCACCRLAHTIGDGWDRFIQAVDELEQAADTDPYAPSPRISTYFHPDWDMLTLTQWAAKGMSPAPSVLRDIVGNPWRPLAWRKTSVLKCGICGGYGHSEENGHPQVLSLAHAAYDERNDGTLDNAHLAVLSDALEEAGCDQTILLDHLRSDEPHYRGCWALDLILGKQ